MALKQPRQRERHKPMFNERKYGFVLVYGLITDFSLGVFSQGVFISRNILWGVCVPTMLSSSNNLRVFTDRALIDFLHILALCLARDKFICGTGNFCFISHLTCLLVVDAVET